jgi:hypothetical protein
MVKEVVHEVDNVLALLGDPRIHRFEAVGFATPAHSVATFRRTMGVMLGALQAALLR